MQFSTQVDVNNREELLKIVKSSIGTKFVKKWYVQFTLMCSCKIAKHHAQCSMVFRKIAERSCIFCVWVNSYVGVTDCCGSEVNHLAIIILILLLNLASSNGQHARLCFGGMVLSSEC